MEYVPLAVWLYNHRIELNNAVNMATTLTTIGKWGYKAGKWGYRQSQCYTYKKYTPIKYNENIISFTEREINDEDLIIIDVKNQKSIIDSGSNFDQSQFQNYELDDSYYKIEMDEFSASTNK